MSDVYSLMKYLTPYELDHIKFLAHNDEIPYQIINSQYNINKNDANTWIDIIENNIDVEKSFILTLKKSDTYGIFDIYSRNNKIGISRITTIELQTQLIELLKQKLSIKVRAMYNFKFDKWEVEDIIDFNLEDNNLEDINKHVDMLSKLSKPIYLEQNC